MQKLWRVIAASFTVSLACGLAACTNHSDQLPDPSNTMPVMAYLSSEQREAMIAEAFDEAEVKITEAHEAGTLATNDADVTTDKNTGRKTLVVKQTAGISDEIKIEGPIKGTSMWVITFREQSSTIQREGFDTADDIHNHDVAALTALEDFVDNID